MVQMPFTPAQQILIGFGFATLMSVYWVLMVYGAYRFLNSNAVKKLGENWGCFILMLLVFSFPFCFVVGSVLATLTLYAVNPDLVKAAGSFHITASAGLGPRGVSPSSFPSNGAAEDRSLGSIGQNIVFLVIWPAIVFYVFKRYGKKPGQKTLDKPDTEA